MKAIDIFIQKGVFDGAVILAGNLEKDLFMHTQGLADRTINRTMSVDTVFDVSSVSKPVGTATALALCMEHGQIDPDRPFQEYLPQFTGKTVAPVTVRHLAYHYSGIEPDYPLNTSADELMRRMLGSNFPHPPMTQYRYCCVNYDFLGFILENVTKTPLEVFAKENIFTPLQMTDTNWGAPLEHTRPRLVRHGRCVDSDPGIIFDRWARVLYPHVVGNAGIFTTAPDLARYARMILRNGKGVFLTDIIEREFLPNKAPEGMYERSLGWNKHRALMPDGFSEKAIFHSGSSGQTFWIDPEKQFFLIILTNLFGDHDEGIEARLKIANEVMKILSGSGAIA